MKMTMPLRTVPDPADSEERRREQSQIRRVNAADGGHEIQSGALGSRAPRPDPMKGEFFDFEDVKSGVVDRERGEVYFSADEESFKPRTDRTYRGGQWKPPADAHEGIVVKGLYPTT